MRHIIKVEVTGFDSFNKKSVGQAVTWFRCDARLARSSKFLRLSSGAKHLWVWLLCESAQSRLREAYVCPRDISSEIHVLPKNVLSALQELVSLEWIRIVTSPYERTNERNERNERQNKESPPPADPIPQTELILNAPPSEVDSFGVEELKSLWNSDRGSFAECTRLSDERRKKIRTQLGKYPDREHWTEALNKFKSSTFCKTQWKPDFDDFLSESKRLRAIEGKYDDRAAVEKNSRKGKDISPEYQRPTDSSFEDEMVKKYSGEFPIEEAVEEDNEF